MRVLKLPVFHFYMFSPWCFAHTASSRRKAYLSGVGRGMIGVKIYNFNLNISPRMSCGMLECDIVLLQSEVLMILS